jgi:VCBS repeat protein/FG-GAP repeat protein
MKAMLTRMFVVACVLLCATGVRGQVPNPVNLSGDTASSSGVFSADLNGDGRADLVTGNGVLFGNADGTFTPGPTFSLGTTSSNCPKPTCEILFTVVAMADFNGDGKPDLLVELLPNSSPGPTSVYVLPGNGDGSFGAPVASNVGVFLSDVQVVDLNHDGKLDLVGNSPSPTGEIFVSLGHGDGTFGVSQPYTVAAGTFVSVVTGDFNGDGKVDIAFATSVPNAIGSIGVLFGNGDGTFATSAVTSTGVNSPGSIVAADLNGDGKLDLVLGGQRLSDFTEQTYLLKGNGDGTFQAPSIIAPGSGFVSVADVNVDGKPDLVIWVRPFVEILLGNGDGTFQQKATYPSEGGIPAAIGDFNGDGKLDIADGSTASFGNGDGTFRNVDAAIANMNGNNIAQLTTVVTGDFNGDGKADLAVGSSNLLQSIFILLGDGTGRHTLANVYSISSNPTTLQTGDFNGDQKTDLVFSTQNLDGTTSVQVMLGHGDGSFATPVASSLGPGTVGSPGPAISVADFNGDGLADVAAVVNGQFEVLIGAGDGTLEAPVTYFGGANPTSFGLGDFNGDGKADATVCGGAGIAVLFGKGDGTLEPAIFSQAAPPPSAGAATCQITAVADFDNDGLSDLLEPGMVLLSNGDGTFTPAATGTPSATAKVVADVNGDGILDLIDSNGVTAFPGNGDGTFSNVASQTINFQPAWISPLIWANYNSQTDNLQNEAVFAVEDFAGTGLPGIAMVVQSFIGGEISLPNPLPAPTPDFVFSVWGNPGVIAPGGEVTLIVAVNRIAGFNMPVELSVGALPDGVTVTFNGAIIGAGEAPVTITVTSSATMGTYPLTFTGTAGSLSHAQTRAITIASGAGATNAHLGPFALNFGAQPVATQGAVQTATLTNAGSAALQVSSVSITGANAADFISSNNCGTPVAAFTSCQIAVMFSPLASGARTGTLTVSDNATGGLQTISLSGSGEDFAVGPGFGGSSATVAAGTSATYALTVSENTGFGGKVNLSCSGAPTAATCSVSPTSVMINAGTPPTAAVTVTVTTTARSEIVTPTAQRDDRQTPLIHASPRVVAIYAATLAVLFGLAAAFGARRRRGMLWAPLAAGVLLLALMGMSGCGGGGGSSSTGGGTNPPPSGGTATGTPAGSYTITVTATAGSGANAVSHTTKLTLVVQ